MLTRAEQRSLLNWNLVIDLLIVALIFIKNVNLHLSTLTIHDVNEVSALNTLTRYFNFNTYFYFMITQQFFTTHLNVYWNENDVSISKHCRINIRCPLFEPKDTMQYFIRRNIQTLIKTFVYPEKKLLVRKLETKYTTARPLTQNGQTNSLPPNLFCWKPIEITIKYNIILDVNWTE